jgi:branched-chain amino acid transport system ATP-binding protein
MEEGGIVILETKGLCKRFGGLKAVNNVSLNVDEGQIYGLIGPNGAGKTTFLNTIAGVYRADGGNATFKGKDITNFSSDKITHAGMARTFQIVHSFADLSALQNVMVGAIFGNKKSKENPEKIANDMLDFVEFPSKHEILAKELNTVQLKRLELARALSTGCDLLLLDELAAGLTPAELDDLSVLIKKIRDKGVTIIMVEHLMKLIMGVCDRIAVLYFGEKIAEGTPEEITHNEKVLEAYLGGASELT